MEDERKTNYAQIALAPGQKVGPKTTLSFTHDICSGKSNESKL
jgi:hypothetical protein